MATLQDLKEQLENLADLLTTRLTHLEQHIKGEEPTPSVEPQTPQTPTKEELKQLLWEMPMQYIAKRYNVAPRTITNWAKKWKLSKPAWGYWSRKGT